MTEKTGEEFEETQQKKYFVQVPNIIVDGHAVAEIGVYTYIKRRTGEKGSFFEAGTSAAKNLGMSKDTFRKIRDKLEKEGVIKFVGWKKGKSHPVKEFTVTDIWLQNISKYEGLRSIDENKVFSKG